MKMGKLCKDRAACAFRKYARLGLDRRELDTFEVYGVIRGVCRTDREAAELLAVFDTLRLLSLTDPESAEAVADVYFFDRGRKPLKNQIGQRVLYFANKHHLDERTVYRRLYKAKELYYHLCR